jgi:hypothetical protein
MNLSGKLDKCVNLCQMPRKSTDLWRPSMYQSIAWSVQICSSGKICLVRSSGSSSFMYPIHAADVQTPHMRGDRRLAMHRSAARSIRHGEYVYAGIKMHATIYYYLCDIWTCSTLHMIWSAIVYCSSTWLRSIEETKTSCNLLVSGRAAQRARIDRRPAMNEWASSSRTSATAGLCGGAIRAGTPPT